MSELEEEGFLTHPHTSAGRIPTDKGYRSYVDSLVELQRDVLEEEDRVRKEYDNRIKELQELLVQTTQILSGLSSYGGFILAPKSEKNILQYLELIHLAEHKILVVMVTHTGMVKHRIIEARISRERLNELNRVLNSRLRGLSLSDARQCIVSEIEESERQEQEIRMLAQGLCNEIFCIDDEVYLTGATKVLDLPDFQEYGPMKSLLRLNDEKELLVDILNGNILQEGVQVLIGSEMSHSELKDLSVISTVYKNGDNPVGVLGIVGPKRMEYEKMMVLVSAVSKIVNKLLSRLGG
jgi:heat-inducible transcriptional repressor